MKFDRDSGLAFGLANIVKEKVELVAKSQKNCFIYGGQMGLGVALGPWIKW